MSNLSITYQLIADILSYSTSKSKLETTLKSPNFNWDTIVVEGSKHLILPTIYCRLKKKKLLHVLPKELELYLEEITSINRNRNTSILKQTHTLSKLLNKNKIEHVFLKGAALLASECYEDMAERMVGDIDILVSKDHLNTAFELIKNNGYNNTYGYAYKTIGFRHLDRLISDNELAAVEVHSNLLNDDFSHFISAKKVLNSKRQNNNIYIPNNYYLNKHNIYAWQINNNGYYYKTVHLKHYYDSLILKLYSEKELLVDLSTNKYGQCYIQLIQFYFKEFKTITKNKILINNHLNYLDNFFYKKILMPTKKYYHYISSRLKLIFGNKYYRQHLLKKFYS